MKKLIFFVVLLILAAVIIKYWPNARGIYKSVKPASPESTGNINPLKTVDGQNNTNLPLSVPTGYKMDIYAKDLGNPRDLEFDPNGNLIVSVTGKGKVVAILKGEVKNILTGLNKPHGLQFFGGKLFVAETDKVSVYDYDATDFSATNGKKILELPSGGNHFTRSILVKDGKLYTSIGSSCNVCNEKDARRASIWVSNLDGSDFKPFATGLRNSVFMTIKNGEIWATNMGRDNLGDNIPPETVNIIKENGNYGWPYCYGQKIPDPETNKANKNFDCNKMIASEAEIQAHSAPLGLAFDGNDLFVSLHGSWNRSVPVGYKVIKISGKTQTDFVGGWLKSNGEAWGRPADIIAKPKGDGFYISDDKAGFIYSLTEL